MGPDFVVVSTPILHFLPCVVKAQEPMCVQAFASELAVEGFDEAVVGRLAWPREVQHDTLLVSPDIEIAGNELRSLFDADRLGIADGFADALGNAAGVLVTPLEFRIRRNILKGASINCIPWPSGCKSDSRSAWDLTAGAIHGAVRVLRYEQSA